MAPLSRAFTATTARSDAAAHETTGGSQASSAGGWAAERTDVFAGSHMPLETDSHWSWRNPANLIVPAVLLLILLAGVFLS